MKFALLDGFSLEVNKINSETYKAELFEKDIKTFEETGSKKIIEKEYGIKLENGIMEKIEIKTYEDYCIRFIKYGNSWWAFLKDVAMVLKLEDKKVAQSLGEVQEFLGGEYVKPYPVLYNNGTRNIFIITEKGIRGTVLLSKKGKDAKLHFLAWIFKTLRELS